MSDDTGSSASPAHGGHRERLPRVRVQTSASDGFVAPPLADLPPRAIWLSERVLNLANPLGPASPLTDPLNPYRFDPFVQVPVTRARTAGRGAATREHDPLALPQPGLARPPVPQVVGRSDDELASSISALSLDLLRQTSASATRTQRRLSFSFAALNWMLLVTFAVGMAAFVAALLKGWGADDATDVATAGVFAGLSAAAFVTTFVTRTTDGVSDAGPRSAWIQAIVTTYWSKLAYFTDTASAARDLQEAQEDFDRSIRAFLAATHAQRQTTGPAASAHPDGG